MTVGERLRPLGVETTLDKNELTSLLKKILSKNKSGHSLRIDHGKQQLKLKEERKHLGVLYLEAPYIILPDYEVKKLIMMGKCCGYCGEVLKIYDNGRMKDDGKKDVRERRTSIDKHARYLNGLDCTECGMRWCDKQCLDLDFKHRLLFHRPTNKSITHAFLDVDGMEKDIFYFDRWTELRNVIENHNLKDLFNGIMCILHIYHDSNLVTGYESLVCISSDSPSDYEQFLNINLPPSIKLLNLCEMFNDCFKKLQMPYLKFLKYLTIYQLNNYNGSIYLIFSSLVRKASNVNSKVEYFDDSPVKGYEEFSLRSNSQNDVKMIKEEIIQETKVKPIYTNRTSGIIDKKIIQLTNSSRLDSDTELSILEQDYSNPLDYEDDEIVFLSDDDDVIDTPKIVLPILGTAKPPLTKKIRTASFTSSGASFGEGIIKYNRDQIREMLETMSTNFKVDEGSSTDDDSLANDPIKGKIVSMVKNLQISVPAVGSTGARRKSVKFEDKVQTIEE